MGLREFLRGENVHFSFNLEMAIALVTIVLAFVFFFVGMSIKSNHSENSSPNTAFCFLPAFRPGPGEPSNPLAGGAGKG